jgi:hypothetical protein
MQSSCPGSRDLNRSVWLTTLPPSCAVCLKNLGVSTFWNPQGLSRPVMGLLYLFTLNSVALVRERTIPTERPPPVGEVSANCVGYAVTQLVVSLCYEVEGRGFDSRWCHWNFSLIRSFRPHYGPGVHSASYRNQYQECFLGGKGSRCVGLTTLPLSCADCHKI